jgi:hypothetical protein
VTQIDGKHAPEVTCHPVCGGSVLLRVKSENDIEFIKSFSEQFQPYKPENMYQQIEIFTSTLKVILKEFRSI